MAAPTLILCRVMLPSFHLTVSSNIVFKKHVAQPVKVIYYACSDAGTEGSLSSLRFLADHLTLFQPGKGRLSTQIIFTWQWHYLCHEL